MAARPAADQRVLQAAEPPCGGASCSSTLITADSWCPGRTGFSLNQLLGNAGLRWKLPYNRNHSARCDLFSKQWLFVVSPGGRTGSTTVLDMINAHPAFDLAGENNGQLLSAMELWSAAASQWNDTDGGPWKRSELHPYDLLCDLAAWFEDITLARTEDPQAALTMEALKAHTQMSRLSKAPYAGTPASAQARTVLGFKEIRWGGDATSLRFLNALFPCHRIVVSERSGDWQSKWTNASIAQSKAKGWSRYLRQQPDWHHRRIQLGANGFRLDDFNGMLNWLGEPEDGCRYRHVETANTKGFKGSGNPSELLNVSECRLRL